MAHISQVKVGDAFHVVTIPFGTCSTAAATAAKTVAITNFTQDTGTSVRVQFTYANTAANPTLNVNSQGAKAIVGYGTSAPSVSWKAGAVVDLTFDGTSWVMTGFGALPEGSCTVAGGGLSQGTASGGDLSGGGISGGSLSGGGLTAGNGSASATGNVSLTSNGATAPTTGYYVKVEGFGTVSRATITRSTITRATVSRATFSQAVTRAAVTDAHSAGYLPAKTATTAISSATSTVTLSSGSLAATTSAATTSAATSKSSNKATVYYKIPTGSCTVAGGDLSKGTASGGGLSGGGLTAGTGEVSITTTPAVTPKISGSIINADYGVTTTTPSGTDGTNYLTMDPDGTVSTTGKAKGRGSVSRATISRATFSQAVTRAAITDTHTEGYIPAKTATTTISAATSTVTLAAGSIAGTSGTSNWSSESDITPTVNAGTNYYVPIVAASATAGTATATATVTKTPSASTTASSATATITSTGISAGTSTVATSYYITASASATSGSASASSGVVTASSSATGGNASVGAGITKGASATGSASGDKSATTTEQTASSSAKTDSKTATIYLKAAVCTVAGGGLSQGTASGGGLSGGGISGGAISGGGLTAGNGSVSATAGGGITITDNGTTQPSSGYYIKVAGSGTVNRATITRTTITRAAVSRATFSQAVTRAAVTDAHSAGYLPAKTATTTISAATSTVTLAAGTLAETTSAATTSAATSLSSNTATKYYKITVPTADPATIDDHITTVDSSDFEYDFFTPLVSQNGYITTEPRIQSIFVSGESSKKLNVEAGYMGSLGIELSSEDFSTANTCGYISSLGMHKGMSVDDEGTTFVGNIYTYSNEFDNEGPEPKVYFASNTAEKYFLGEIRLGHTTTSTAGSSINSLFIERGGTNASPNTLTGLYNYGKIVNLNNNYSSASTGAGIGTLTNNGSVITTINNKYSTSMGTITTINNKSSAYIGTINCEAGCFFGKLYNYSDSFQGLFNYNTGVITNIQNEGEITTLQNEKTITTFNNNNTITTLNNTGIININNNTNNSSGGSISIANNGSVAASYGTSVTVTHSSSSATYATTTISATDGSASVSITRAAASGQTWVVSPFTNFSRITTSSLSSSNTYVWVKASASGLYFSGGGPSATTGKYGAISTSGSWTGCTLANTAKTATSFIVTGTGTVTICIGLSSSSTTAPTSWSATTTARSSTMNGCIVTAYRTASGKCDMYVARPFIGSLS